jgi:hypothetical protein
MSRTHTSRRYYNKPLWSLTFCLGILTCLSQVLQAYIYIIHDLNHVTSVLHYTWVMGLAVCTAWLLINISSHVFSWTELLNEGQKVQWWGGKHWVFEQLLMTDGTLQWGFHWAYWIYCYRMGMHDRFCMWVWIWWHICMLFSDVRMGGVVDGLTAHSP